MSDLVAWLREQLDADEAAAREALEVNSLAALLRKIRVWWEYGNGQVWRRREDYPDEQVVVVGKTWDREGAHIAEWDPARVLAEVAAKRAILDDCAGYVASGESAIASTDGLAGRTLLGLAQPYVAAGRPGFDPAWKVEALSGGSMPPIGDADRVVISPGMAILPDRAADALPADLIDKINGGPTVVIAGSEAMAQLGEDADPASVPVLPRIGKHTPPIDFGRHMVERHGKRWDDPVPTGSPSAPLDLHDELHTQECDHTHA